MLAILAKDQDKWEGMVANMGCPEYLIGDVVNDMYLKIHSLPNPEKVLYNENQANYWYIYLTLRTCFADAIKREKRTDDLKVAGGIEAREELDMDKERAFDRLWKKVEAEIAQFGSYGAKLTNTYFKTDISIRGLADGSGISATSIYHSIKSYREYMQSTGLGEDWEDYCNEDYEHI